MEAGPGGVHKCQEAVSHGNGKWGAPGELETTAGGGQPGVKGGAELESCSMHVFPQTVASKADRKETYFLKGPQNGVAG